MIEVVVPTRRLFYLDGTIESCNGDLRIYRDEQKLKPEAFKWFCDTGIPPLYELDDVIIFGSEWSTTFRFWLERDAMLFKLAWGGDQ